MTVGHGFPVKKVRKIELGQTGQTEVLKLFGTPWRTGLEDGQTSWTYAHYEYDLSGQTLARDLVLKFINDGFVSSYSFNSMVPDEANPLR